MLSPVPSFTSEPTPSPLKPPIFLYSLSCPSSTYLLISLVPFLFTPASLLSDPFLFVMRSLTMLTQPHVPAIAPPPELRTRSSSRTPIPVPAPPLDSEPLLYLNLLYLSIQPNLIITFLRYIASYSAVAFLTLRSVSFCKPPPTNSLPPDSVRLRSPTSPKL